MLLAVGEKLRFLGAEVTLVGGNFEVGEKMVNGADASGMKGAVAGAEYPSGVGVSS